MADVFLFFYDKMFGKQTLYVIKVVMITSVHA